MPRLFVRTLFVLLEFVEGDYVGSVVVGSATHPVQEVIRQGSRVGW